MRKLGLATDDLGLEPACHPHGRGTQCLPACSRIGGGSQRGGSEFLSRKELLQDLLGLRLQGMDVTHFIAELIFSPAVSLQGQGEVCMWGGEEPQVSSQKSAHFKILLIGTVERATPVPQKCWGSPCCLPFHAAPSRVSSGVTQLRTGLSTAFGRGDTLGVRSNGHPPEELPGQAECWAAPCPTAAPSLRGVPWRNHRPESAWNALLAPPRWSAFLKAEAGSHLPCGHSRSFSIHSSMCGAHKLDANGTSAWSNYREKLRSIIELAPHQIFSRWFNLCWIFNFSPYGSGRNL